MTAVAQESRVVVNRSGVRVRLDVPRDVSDETFRRLVLDGDIKPADDEKVKATK